MASLNGTPLILGTLDTDHFRFEVLGFTEEDCRDHLKDAWEIHCRDYPGAQMDFMQQALEDDEVNFAVITIGGVLRDGETLL